MKTVRPDRSVSKPEAPRVGPGPKPALVAPEVERLRTLHASLGNRVVSQLLQRAPLPSLTVSRPGDELEREAEEIAEVVARDPPSGNSPTLEPAPTLVIQRQASEAANEESWFHIYAGPERNVSLDYVMAGISKKTAGVSTELVVPVKPGDTFTPPTGWDLDCFVRRDGSAIKFRSALAAWLPAEVFSPEKAAVDFAQYVPKAKVEFEKNPRPEAEPRAAHGIQLSAAGPSTSDASLAVDAIARSGPGKPVQGAIPALFEQRLGWSVQHTLVHDDQAAADAARMLGARAFTIGARVYFGAGEYQPHTREGRQLLAHELTHVVQQGTASRAAAATQRGSQIEVYRKARHESESSDVEHDAALRALAERPWEALREWSQLSQSERTLVIHHMTVLHDLEFAREFLERAPRGAQGAQSIRITNHSNDTPAALAARGFRIRKSTSRVEYWVNPSGQEVWRIPQGPEGPTAPAPFTGPALPKNLRAREVQQIRQRLEALDKLRTQITERALALKQRPNSPNAENEFTAILNQGFKFERALDDVTGDLSDILEKAASYIDWIDPRIQQEALGLMPLSEQLRDWRNVTYHQLMDSLPQPDQR